MLVGADSEIELKDGGSLFEFFENFLNPPGSWFCGIRVQLGDLLLVNARTPHSLWFT